MCKFAIIGVGGYVAKKHVKAICENGGTIVAAHDINDSVGYLDSYSYSIPFYKRAADFTEKMKQADYLVVCTPNYLHREHIELGLSKGLDVICEKPLVIDLHDIKYIETLEEHFKKRCWTILQSRYNKRIAQLKHDIDNGLEVKQANVQYITPRGPWYRESWKGVGMYSGGLIFNIGIHLFDVMQWLFGPIDFVEITSKWSPTYIEGFFKTKTTRIDWTLSIEANSDSPTEPLRILTADDRIINLSEKFTDLHSESYKRILIGKGIGVEDARPAIELAARTRNLEQVKSIYED